VDYRPLLEKMGIDWQARWAEFQEDIERLRRGEMQFLTWEDADAK
jgi:heterodisulfide reductase subunit B